MVISLTDLAPTPARVSAASITATQHDTEQVGRNTHLAQQYEAIVIGGGITGAGIARDCAMRGIRTLLVEKKDFGGGTTGASMGLLHGGRRYVLADPEITRLSCVESGIIQHLAPHLIFRVPWIIPIALDDPEPIASYEKMLTRYDEFGKYKNSPSHVWLTPEEVLEVEPSIVPEIKGGFTRDEPGVDVFRLVIANLLSASENGAHIRNHAEVISVLREGKRIHGVTVRDTLTGEVETYYADYVINAAGPWTPQIAALAGVPFQLRPTKGVHIIFDRRITTTAVSCWGVTVLPHENTTMCGLTDDFFFLHPEEARSERNDVERLLATAEKAIPSIREARVIRTMVGVRPIIDQPGTSERDLSREYKIFDHEQLDGVERFITIAGGKMVLYRIMAQDMTDLLCEKLRRSEVCPTAETSLPGGEEETSAEALADEFGVPLHTVVRLEARHGTRTHLVLGETRSLPHYKSHICECEPVTEAEIRYVIVREWARTLDDLRRRTRLGMGPCQGCRCTSIAAAVLVDQTGQHVGTGHREVMSFLQARWKGRYPVLNGTQLRQEELVRACYLGIGGYDNPALAKIC